MKIIPKFANEFAAATFYILMGGLLLLFTMWIFGEYYLPKDHVSHNMNPIKEVKENESKKYN